MALQHTHLSLIARLGSLSISRPTLATSIPSLLPPSQRRHFVSKGKKTVVKKKKKLSKEFKTYDSKSCPQFSLCDAVRYIRATEVGRPGNSVKYELHVRLKTMRGGPVLRNAIRLPHPIASSVRFAVICPEGSPIADEARQLGAVAIGEETLFERIRKGDLSFDRIICHDSSEAALNKAALGRILGPRGLMPSKKLGTVTGNVRRSMQSREETYRERAGVVRMAIGQMSFTPSMLADNVKAFLAQIKKECATLEDRTTKEVHEVILSSSHGPGFNLNGGFKPLDPNVKEADLSGIM